MSISSRSLGIFLFLFFYSWLVFYRASLKGRIVDRDSALGVFLDIAFGTLTIPLNGNEKIMGGPFLYL